MRLPWLSPSVERRSPVLSPAGRPRGELRPQWFGAIAAGKKVTFVITIGGCVLKHCTNQSECANYGSCTTCSGGVCQN
jgi:hypothetical protein